jgi:DNA-binding transcriptional MerR regulator
MLYTIKHGGERMKQNRAIPNGYMTVGELAKKMNTTVRTLQYYDREGLLSPSKQSGGGLRLYTNKDMVKLHQIQSMKYLGFSLEERTKRLSPLR